MTPLGRRLWMGLALLIVLTPLGVLTRRTAWGEWAGEELKGILGYVPTGLMRGEHAWRAPFRGYSLTGAGGSPVEYALSALIGAAAVVIVAGVAARILAGGGPSRRPPP